MAIKRSTNITAPALTKPIVGASTDRWGDIWNDNIDKLTEFNTKVVADSENQNQELARLEREKVSKTDVPDIVEPVVQEFLETTIKPEIDDYIDTVSKPDITSHVENKKQEINTYVNTTSKPALDAYEKEKEKELNTYTTTKKGELDSHTTVKRGELDAYEKTKETQLNNYTSTKQIQLDSYTNTKKGELDTHTTAKEGRLDTYTTGKEGELDTHTAEKKSELDAYEETKERELNTFTSTKKTEIINHTNTKKGELDTYTTQKKGEITTHTDSEIERINADSELAKKQNITDSRIIGGSKNIVDAINERLWLSLPKAIGNSSTNTDLNDIKQKGYYASASTAYLFTNLPSGSERSFTLNVIGIEDNYGTNNWISQILKSRGNNRIWVRTRDAGKQTWTSWVEILNSSSRLFLGTSGISSITYIQDSGTKTQGQDYIDKSTGQVYLCLKTNTDTTITNKFMSITNVELGKKVESGFWKLNPKGIGSTTTPIDLNTIVENGFYVSNSSSYKWLNLPTGFPNAFELMVTGVGGINPNSYRTQIIKAYNSNSIWIRSDITNEADGWSAWTKIVLDTDIIDNLTTANKSKVLSANMGVKLNTSGYDGQGRGTLRNNSLNIDQIKKSGAWYIYDKNLKPFIGIDYAYLQHIQYNDYDVGAWQLMCPDNKLELYTRVCAGISGRYTDWEQILTSNNKLFLGNAGISKVIYIQDAGEKTAGNGYVDKTTGQLYLCKTTNSDTSVTSNFTLATNIENSNKIKMISKIRIRNGYTIWVQHYFNGMYLQVFSSTVSSVTEDVILNLDELGVSDNNYKLQAVSFVIGTAIKNDNVSIPLNMRSEENARTIKLSLTDYSNLKFVHGMCFIPSNKVPKLSEVN